MPKQVCPVCLNEFYAMQGHVRKIYCTDKCKTRAKTMRKRESDARVAQSLNGNFYEVLHNPTPAQVGAIALFMLNGGTNKESKFTGVNFVFKAPPGLDWTVIGGEAFLQFHIKSFSEEMAEAKAKGVTVTFSEAPKVEAPVEFLTQEEKLERLFGKQGLLAPQQSCALPSAGVSRADIEAELLADEAPRATPEDL